MSKQKEEKTNVMRVLDQKKIPYTPHTYPVGLDYGLSEERRALVARLRDLV